MRKLSLGIVIGFLFAATSAVAITVVLPNRTKAKAMVVVDVLGQVLFSEENPAKVEVVNQPSGPTAQSWSAWSTHFYHNGDEVVSVFVVPAGQTLLLTDIVSKQNSNVPDLKISSLSGGTEETRLRTQGNYSFTTGIEFAGGETLKVETIRGNSHHLTLMGRLTPEE